MNKQRRKALQDIIEQLETLKDDIDAIRYDEQEAFDNLPESFQTGERGEAMEEAISNLEDAVNYMDEVIGNIEAATE